MASYKDTKTGRTYSNVSQKALDTWIRRDLISTGRYVEVKKPQKPKESE